MWAVVFPGQGSQKTGMGRFYYDGFHTAKRLFESASDELKIDFKKLCFEGPDERLTLTQNAQPAIVLVSCVAWFCLSEELDLSQIKYSAGHSVGEYSALVCAGALSLNEALQVVRKRGLYMSACSPKDGLGGMSALMGASVQEAREFCKWVEQKSGLGPLEPANFNTAQQTVLSGTLKALEWASGRLKEYPAFGQTRKIRLIPLQVSAPFHSSVMEPACQKMRKCFEILHFQNPKKMIVQNRTARAETDPSVLQRNLVEQVKEPVLWFQSMEHLFEQGIHRFLELGEGKVLAGLMKKIDPSKPTFHFHSLKDIEVLKKYFPF